MKKALLPAVALLIAAGTGAHPQSEPAGELSARQVILKEVNGLVRERGVAAALTENVCKHFGLTPVENCLMAQFGFTAGDGWKHHFNTYDEPGAEGDPARIVIASMSPTVIHAYRVGLDGKLASEADGLVLAFTVDKSQKPSVWTRKSRETAEKELDEELALWEKGKVLLKQAAAAPPPAAADPGKK
jgi:hypothetical protein